MSFGTNNTLYNTPSLDVRLSNFIFMIKRFHNHVLFSNLRLLKQYFRFRPWLYNSSTSFCVRHVTRSARINQPFIFFFFLNNISYWCSKCSRKDFFVIVWVMWGFVLGSCLGFMWVLEWYLRYIFNKRTIAAYMGSRFPLSVRFSYQCSLSYACALFSTLLLNSSCISVWLDII